MQLNAWQIAYPVTALGPGKRIALWVAGCPLRCQGCITPHLLDPQSGTKIDVELLVEHLANLPVPLDGLTLTGGEPFAQASALTHLLKRLRCLRPMWNVLAFSGYPLVYLQKQVETAMLLAEIDWLVDGPYLPERPARHPLLASANQQLHSLSAAGDVLLHQIQQQPAEQANVGLSRDGHDVLIGILSPVQRQQLHQQLCITSTTAQ